MEMMRSRSLSKRTRNSNIELLIFLEHLMRKMESSLLEVQEVLVVLMVLMDRMVKLLVLYILDNGILLLLHLVSRLYISLKLI